MSDQPSFARPGKGIAAHFHPPVFYGASAIIFFFLAIGLVFPDRAESIFSSIQSSIISGFGWLYILAVGAFVLAMLYVALSRFGQLKLGPDDAEPEYNYLTWLAMLFAAGMGIGLMFYGVAEPVMHYSSPPVGDGGTVDAARNAMVYTFFHWGFHAWAIYAVVGLSLAYFAYRYNLPLAVRSGLYPIFKNRIYGPIGDAVDIFAIVGTLFGVATSLGLGVMQINAGFNYLFGLPNTTFMQIVLIAVITGMATMSVVTGLDVGIRRLSETNLILAVLLMFFVLFVGPTVFLLGAFPQNLGNYLGHFFERTFTMYAYEPNDWLSDWTLFYWSWWIAWSPFVGMFIARISRGRTVREFVLSVLFIPPLFTFFWMTVFGNSGIALDMGAAAGAIAEEVNADIATALFQFFEYLPGTTIMSGLAILLVTVFFVTSSDSGSLVVETLAAGGREDAPVAARVYWAVLEGVIAALLLLAGGLTALQTMTLISALPFVIVMILLVYGLLKGMNADMARLQPRLGPVAAHPVTELPWTARLNLILNQPQRQDVGRFIKQTAEPALEAVAHEMRERGLDALVAEDRDEGVALTVNSQDVRSFVYGVEPQRHLVAAFTAGDVSRGETKRPHVWWAKTYFGDGSRGYDVMGFTREQIISDILAQYERYQTMMHSHSTALYLTSPDPGQVA
ncbi:BCCT family transporter [Lutibaculum baratangense]|uniref:High-affinity choline uptake protein BetT n=1 Tax=Lutibaculum baratangense AMV1 TaxID=631454 RepID=V4RKY7_9HYPH|nr:BCCT family transporter [Lutibaculum baratangense]ESR23875.1 High-affinity choline uptake protein BetT [Lutibaculum baratangense AMV1]